MQDVSKKPDMVSIRISRESRDALSSVKYSEQSMIALSESYSIPVVMMGGL